MQAAAKSSKEKATEGELTPGQRSADDSLTGGKKEAGRVLGEQSYEKCLADITLFVGSFALGAPWAIQMFDAFGKQSQGVLTGNVRWPGAYKECLDVRATDLNSTTELFKGQYCTATIKTSKESIPPSVTAYPGICIPDSCNDTNARAILAPLVTEMEMDFTLSNVVCQIEHPLDTITIVAICVFAFVGFLMALGTALDIVLVQMPKWRMARMPAILKKGIDSYSAASVGETQPLLNSKTPTHPEEPGLCAQLLISFSVYTNGSKLLSTRQPPGSLTSVHGIRFFSMTWVVLGHTFSAVKKFSYNSAVYQKEAYDRFSFQMVANATPSVDTFFVLSGLLVAYLSLKELDKNKGKLNWPLFFFHRFWRLTPLYMMVIFFNISIEQYMGSGPNWFDRDKSREACEENWWTNLLYINNLVNLDKRCLGESWYLANDMQFYLLSPLIFVPFYYSPYLGGLSSLAFLLATTISPGVITSELHFTAGSAKLAEKTVAGANSFNDYYIKPYCRMGPYVVGLVAGYILYKYASRIRMNRIVALCGWAVAGGVGMAVIFGLYDASKVTDTEPLEVWEAALWNSLGRTAWGVCVAWVIIACHTGYGGFINTLLSWEALIPLSRLTYTLYLIHMTALAVFGGIMRVPMFMNDIDIVMYFLSLMAMCYMVGAIVSLAFEAPMMGLEKILLHGNKKK
ncbi:hypothetical protein BaRGS_00011739 [Batillaria attramentaria]|uniref:Nose resistant-to-fluoxetine protein N-terminal domain-containing protein n=1 Tax=Batillaria attramentaria TaxID=370345 RepID=A0ABD0LC49_9CAEN